MVEEKTAVSEYRRRKSLLVEALRSGAYDQGVGKLKFETSRVCHCVLGVACDIYRTQHPELRDWIRGCGRKRDTYRYPEHASGPDLDIEVRAFGGDTILTEAVRAWYGFTDHVGGLVTYAEEKGLRELMSRCLDDGYLGEGPPRPRLLTLSELNDYARVPFAELADIIDNEPSTMFVWAKTEEE